LIAKKAGKEREDFDFVLLFSLQLTGIAEDKAPRGISPTKNKNQALSRLRLRRQPAPY
jgi:hypothetical protein